MIKPALVSFTAIAMVLTLSSTHLRADESVKPAEPKTEQRSSHWRDVGPVALWPGLAPGEKEGADQEKDTTKDADNKPGGKRIIKLANVTKPTITIFRPAPDKETGAAVVVCPGGGYGILAYDLEGSEICEWLNSVGVTGVLLKYRVPGKRAGALQDAQRAIGMVRHRAGEWGIDPKRIGILGFSAGGHLTAAASNNFETRTYEPVDDSDKESCRPDFSVLIYPAYLTAKDDTTKLAPDLKVTDKTPPAFCIMTEDDPIKVENVYTYALALKAVKVPVEVHTFAKGGHGYGLRPGAPVTNWPALAADWMKASGWLEKKK